MSKVCSSSNDKKNMPYLSELLQSGAVIMRSIFFNILKIDTPYLPISARYGEPVVILKSDSLSATVMAMPYVILW